MASHLSAPHFHNEEAAYVFIEALLWPEGPVCPHCANVDQTKIGRLDGKTTRPGLRKCYVCRKPFTVKMGTIFEASHAPLRIWLQAIYLICSSKKGISTRQLQRTLGVGMKTAWFLGHRIRHAMGIAPEEVGPLGGEGKIVEADETFRTNSNRTRKSDHARRKMAVMSLVERGGELRSFAVASTKFKDVLPVLHENVHPDSTLHTDGAQIYKAAPVAKHESVDHSKREYVRGDVHVNTLEGYFSVFKRGMVGVYQHCEEQHLHRYLAEFDFRQNTREKLGINDAMRTERAVKSVKGKRLTYRTTHSEEVPR